MPKITSSIVHELVLKVTSHAYLNRAHASTAGRLPESLHPLTDVRIVTLCLRELQSFFPGVLIKPGTYSLCVSEEEFPQSQKFWVFDDGEERELHIRTTHAGATVDDVERTVLRALLDLPEGEETHVWMRLARADTPASQPTV